MPEKSKSIFDGMSNEQIANLDRAMKIADGIKLYQSAGGIGVGAQWAPYAQKLAERGGLTSQEALNLSRYRMWKQGMNVPEGEREPDLSDDEKNKRREEFINGTAQVRARLLDEDKKSIERSHQGYFDTLVKQNNSDYQPPASIAAPGIQGIEKNIPPQSIAIESPYDESELIKNKMEMS